MSCPSEIEIERSLDGAPADIGAAPIEAHLEECPRCRARAEAIQALDASLAAGLLARERRLQRVSPRLLSRVRSRGEEELARRRERARAALGRRNRLRPQPGRARERSSAVLVGASLAALAAATLLFGLARFLSTRDEPRAPEVAKAPPPEEIPALRMDRVLFEARAEKAAAPPVRPAALFASAPVLAAAPEPPLAAARNPARFESDERPAALSPPEVAPPVPAAAPLVATASVSPFFGPEPVGDAGAAPLRVRHAHGDLRLALPGSAAFVRVASRSPEIAAAGRIRAEGAGGSLVLEDGTEIALRGGAEASLARDEARGGGFALSLERGEVLADVPPLAGGGLRVRTRHGQVRGEGGRFAVRAGPIDTSLFVLEGRAEIEAVSGAAGVSAGEAAVAGARGRLVTRRATEAEVSAAVALGERAGAPRSVVFEWNFERGLGLFEGTLAPARERAGRALLLRPLRNDQHWGERASLRRAGLYRARPGAEIRFAYNLPAPSPILVQAQNDTQKALYRAVILEPAVGRWAAAVVFVADFQRASGGSIGEPPHDGDVFSSVEIFAGRSGYPADLQIDDVAIVER